MFEKLLALLLHAKAGAISGVFLLGATGALVTVSAQNGVTTITLTDPSPSPSASASPHPSASASPTASGSPQLSSANPLSSPKPDACSDEAKALGLQVKRVDSAFQTFHTDLMKLRGQRSVVTIEKADVLLKQVRQAAVKAIHATATCKKHDDDEDKDEDKDENDEHDATTGTTSLNADREKDEDNDKDERHGESTSSITFTGDAKSIADQAITAMQTAFDAAKNAPASTPKPSHKPESSRSPKATSSHKPEHRD